MFTITSFYAALVALIYLVLSFRVISYRRRNRIGLGDAGDRALLKRIRAHANCAEFAPLSLILLGLCEAQGTPSFVLHLLGVMLVAGRAMHGIGFSAHPMIMPLRAGGVVVSVLMLALTALGLLLHAVF